MNWRIGVKKRDTFNRWQRRTFASKFDYYLKTKTKRKWKRSELNCVIHSRTNATQRNEVFRWIAIFRAMQKNCKLHNINKPFDVSINNKSHSTALFVNIIGRNIRHPRSALIRIKFCHFPHYVSIHLLNIMVSIVCRRSSSSYLHNGS